MLRRVGFNCAFLVTLAVYVLLGTGLASFEWAEELRDRFLIDDPALAALESEEALFGSGEPLYVLVQWLDGPVPSTLRDDLDRWTDELRRLNGVADVLTVLDLPTVVWRSPANWLFESQRDADLPLAAVFRGSLARKNLVRRDSKGTVIALSLDPDRTRRFSDRRELLTKLEGWRAGQSARYTYRFAGTLPFQDRVVGVADRDVRRIFPVVLILSVFVLYFATRSVATVIVLISLAIMNVAVTFGLSSWAGWEVSRSSTVVAAVIFAIGLLDNVHIAYAYARESSARESSDNESTLFGVLAELWRPCALTTLTTAVGFSVLLTSSLPQVRQFGWLALVGSVVALVTSFAVLPFVLLRTGAATSGFGSVLALRVGELRKKSWLVGSVLVFAGVATLGLTKLSVRADFPRLFSADHPLVAEMEKIEEQWGGLATVSFLVRAKEPNAAISDAGLERLAGFLSLLGRRELVTSVSSPMDVFLEAQQTFRYTFERAMTPEEKRHLVEQFLVMDGGLPSVSDGVMRVVARVRMMDPDGFPSLSSDLHGFRENLSEFYDVELGGWPLLFKNIERRLVEDLFRSFLLAFVLVLPLLYFCAGSLRLWMLALIPNVLPVVLVVGGLGLSGMGLSSGILMAPGIALGLVVDDTVHFVTQVRRQLAEQHHVTGAIEEALRTTGATLTVTTVLLILAFAGLLLSEFSANRVLGAVMMMIAALAWFADIVVLPAILERVELRHRQQR